MICAIAPVLRRVSRWVIVVMKYRLTCYCESVDQRVQVGVDGQRTPNIHGDGPLPSGYVDAPSSPTAEPAAEPRACWTEPVRVAPTDAGELKWSADELIGRATHVQSTLDQMEAEAGLAALPPEERRKAFAALQKSAKKFCATFGGLRGLPRFSELSYFRCADICSCVHRSSGLV